MADCQELCLQVAEYMHFATFITVSPYSIVLQQCHHSMAGHHTDDVYNNYIYNFRRLQCLKKGQGMSL